MKKMEMGCEEVKMAFGTVTNYVSQLTKVI
jgi:hypothetical protein